MWTEPGKSGILANIHMYGKLRGNVLTKNMPVIYAGGLEKMQSLTSTDEAIQKIILILRPCLALCLRACV